MSYRIDAWLEKGEPRLGVVDAYTGEVRQLWHLHKIGIPAGRRNFPMSGPMEMHQLVKTLFLLGCAEDIALAQRGVPGNLSEICLGCGQCAAQAHEESHIVSIDFAGRRRC